MTPRSISCRLHKPLVPPSMADFVNLPHDSDIVVFPPFKSIYFLTRKNNQITFIHVLLWIVML